MSSKTSIWIHLKKIKIKIKIKRKIKTSLWKKIPKKDKQNNNSPNQENSVSSEIGTNNKLILYSNEASLYPIEDLLKLNYIYFVFLNIIYLHYETNKVDFCIQSIRNNPILEYAFRLSYNAFRTKFNTLQTISHDQGENLSLELSRSCQFFSMLTHFLRLLPPPFSVLGGVIRLGISEVNRRNKILKSKNVLKFCNTYESFTRIVSLLFSSILIKGLADIENLDELVEKNFSVFWKILNEHAEQSLENEKSPIPVNIENFWAYCFGLFALTLFCNSKNSLNTLFDSSQQASISNINPFYNAKFFDKKKQSLPFLKLNNISQFWENKTAYTKDVQFIEELKFNILPRLIVN